MEKENSGEVIYGKMLKAEGVNTGEQQEALAYFKEKGYSFNSLIDLAVLRESITDSALYAIEVGAIKKFRDERVVADLLKGIFENTDRSYDSGVAQIALEILKEDRLGAVSAANYLWKTYNDEIFNDLVNLIKIKTIKGPVESWPLLYRAIAKTENFRAEAVDFLLSEAVRLDGYPVVLEALGDLGDQRALNLMNEYLVTGDANQKKIAQKVINKISPK